MASDEQQQQQQQSMPMSTQCVVHRHRRPVPTEIHHVWPKGMGGPDIRANKAPLCSDGHGEVHNYLDLLMDYDTSTPRSGADHVPWLKKIRYGKYVRQLALLGYSRYVRGSM